MENSLKQYIVARCPVPVWLRKLGFVGFLFFFIKGMAWIAVSAVALIGLF
jgi:hypothetical protein